MAQKDKVKELVGRSLDSYHTKSLQQIDRIEKKNKEQNHKINILTNELDNDYLTKTEEGSVVSLEHSKEGMVYLDGLQGNTLVNYCTDGAKELTLNGDIDVEGTSVTLTEGVDNGKVDVVCEGNTLVNCIQPLKLKSDFYSFAGTIEDGYLCFTGSGHYKNFFIGLDKIVVKPSTTYTFVVDIKENTLISESSKYLTFGETQAGGAETYWTRSHWIKSTEIGRKVFTLTTKSSFDNVSLGDRSFIDASCTSGTVKLRYMILEGDWTNKEIPQYFEGMKSVGECEDNKIEILSQNKNLFNKDNITTGFYLLGQLSDTYGTLGASNYTNISNYMPVKQGKTYVFSYEYETLSNAGGRAYCYYDNNKKIIIPKTDTTYDVSKKSKTYTPQQDGYIRIAYDKNCTNIQFEQSDVKTSYSSYVINKKEISLNEPLRALLNGVKDKIVKIGGNKWYVERNCGELVLDGSQDCSISGSNGVYPSILRLWVKNISDLKEYGEILCDKLPIVASKDYPSMVCTNGLDVHLPLSNDTSLEVAKQWLSENPIKVVYTLVTPTYEEITDPQVITYLDTTHISNNSTIPCNMVVKNTGYNAIIKPSTLYTVALDTNKSGTVGINLGGAKVTTTNNVATITTPATLVDDSLRLHGKGIKASNVRLLEGDKTNCVPSYFEGMKSSFEDKLQDDGTYKMEILSNNKNLLNLPYTNEKRLCSSKTLKAEFSKSVTVGKTYTFSFATNLGGTDGSKLTYCLTYGEDYNNINRIFVGISKYGKERETITFTATSDKIYFIGGVINVCEYWDFQLEENTVPTNYIPHKSNKIQFSSIKPLRGVGDVKDRFVFKDDNKLYILRNCEEVVLDGSSDEITMRTHQINSNLLVFNQSGLHTIGESDGANFTFNSCLSNLFNTHYGYNHLGDSDWGEGVAVKPNDVRVVINKNRLTTQNIDGFKEWLQQNPIKVVYKLKHPYYEEVSFELAKLILEGYENGTLFIDTNIPPTITTTYAGETPIVKATRLNKTEVLNNTNDINDNIVPYLMDMDYRVVCLQLEGGIENISMSRLFGGTYEMLQRDILSNRYSKEEYKYRLDAYLSANKITHEEYTKLGDMLND